MTRGFGIAAVLAALAGATLQGFAAASDLPNPFVRPGGVRNATAPAAPLELELRATLVAGRRSSANIGGTILRLGQELGGYRLTAVHEGTAVLVRAGIPYVLEIERTKESSR
jgi:hypothetical protein